MISLQEACWKWHQLATRHLDMALYLFTDGFYDGALFHIYHAYESALGAILASCDCHVPPDGSYWARRTQWYPTPKPPFKRDMKGSAHAARLELASLLIMPTMACHDLYRELAPFMSVTLRNNSLYYDRVTDYLPHQRWSKESVEGHFHAVLTFVAYVEQDIKSTVGKDRL